MKKFRILVVMGLLLAILLPSCQVNEPPKITTNSMEEGENTRPLPEETPSKPSLPPSGDPASKPTPTPPKPPVPTPKPPVPTPKPPVPTPKPPVPTPKPPVPTPTPTPTPPPFNPLEFHDYQYEFKADLSDFEKYMNPKGEDYLILVNSTHALTGEDIPDDLVDCVNTRKDRDPVPLRLQAAKALEALFLEADANGILYENRVFDGKYYHDNVLSVTSAYRSYYTQEWLFNSYVDREMRNNPSLSRKEAEKIVATYSCRPGQSEHQTGLCVDMHNYPTAQTEQAEEFASNKAGSWLIENCHKFGYVLRFEKDKEDITGITYESWHFRYVGRFHATRMKELDMCLEEYVEYLSDYGYVING